jgi:hypothetical protein
MSADNTRTLSVSDINTTINHEPRILDIRLAEALGFHRPADIRPLITRHETALRRFGEVFRTVRKTTSNGGRPGREYWLTKKQALFLCTKSETVNATRVTIEMVEVFDAVTSGKLVRVKEHYRRKPSTMDQVTRPKISPEAMAYAIPYADVLATSEEHLRRYIASTDKPDRGLLFAYFCVVRHNRTKDDKVPAPSRFQGFPADAFTPRQLGRSH